MPTIHTVVESGEVRLLSLMQRIGASILLASTPLRPSYSKAKGQRVFFGRKQAYRNIMAPSSTVKVSDSDLVNAAVEKFSKAKANFRMVDIGINLADSSYDKVYPMHR